MEEYAKCKSNQNEKWGFLKRYPTKNLMILIVKSGKKRVNQTKAAEKFNSFFISVGVVRTN